LLKSVSSVFNAVTDERLALPRQGVKDSGRFSRRFLSLFAKGCGSANPVLVIIPNIAMPSNTLERRVSVKGQGEVMREKEDI
jgi:hypothetical protein